MSSRLHSDDAVEANIPNYMIQVRLRGIMKTYNVFNGNITSNDYSLEPSRITNEDDAVVDIISLETLHQIRTGALCRENNRVNSSDIQREFDSFPSGTLLMDVTIKGRDLDALRKLAFSHNDKHVLFSTSPWLYLSLQDRSAIAQAMRAELLVGLPVENNVYVKASAISCHLLQNSNTLTPLDLLYLESSAAVHVSGVLVPIIIEIGSSPQLVEADLAQVINLLVSNGADLSRVILTHLLLTRNTVKQLIDIMTSTNIHVCVDSFGYSSLYNPPTGRGYPSDEEVVDCVCSLLDRVDSSRVMLSVHVRQKLFLRIYGGPGYSWLDKSVLPRFGERSVDRSSIQKMTCGNWHELLGWRQEQIVEEKPPDTLDCYICGRAFVPGDHYTKFSFEYCSSKCLAAHRKVNFTPLTITPTTHEKN